jgi:hypothetical protein
VRRGPLRTPGALGAWIISEVGSLSSTFFRVGIIFPYRSHRFSWAPCAAHISIPSPLGFAGGRHSGARKVSNTYSLGCDFDWTSPEAHTPT